MARQLLLLRSMDSKACLLCRHLVCGRVARSVPHYLDSLQMACTVFCSLRQLLMAWLLGQT